MKKLLVTGGAGFIGSNFIHYVLKKHADIHVVNLDALTYAGNPDNLKELTGTLRYSFIQGDITDSTLLKTLFTEHDFAGVVHFAAESHVDRSITGPDAFVQTNVVGTHALLMAARSAWEGKLAEKRFLHVSTDEVYGSLGPKGLFTEQTPLAPNSPYSASKAGSDLLVRSYFETFGFPGIITRCSNNYGPYQFPEKLIPLMITNALAGIPLPVYGDGMNVRDWLYVGDHCSALDTVFNKGKCGEVYNIGGNNEKPNIFIVKTVLAELGKPESLISYVKDRLGHDRRYAIDSSKLQRELGWSPAVSFEQGIRQTIRWYLDNAAWLENLKKRAH
ncbi:MAG: dTDP-glucose 4,6-dehydratase [Chitinispirillaceae bacterium]|jgi:dTDP-glucose 4,6-dehydratase|nr:dTDP-glucose 4,6-dehydratase [Chitinispirillaceae bacterium]